MNKINIISAVILSACLYFTTAAADTMPVVPQAPVSTVNPGDGVIPAGNDNQASPVGSIYVGIGTGFMFPHLTHTTNFTTSGLSFLPSLQDKYVTNHAKSSIEASFLAGYRWQCQSQWLSALSLGVEYTYSRPELSGNIFKFSLPQAKIFQYKYKVAEQAILLKLKFNFHEWHHFSPYASVGAGIAVNHVYGYTTGLLPNVPPGYSSLGNFASATTTNFADSFGAGIDYWVNNNLQLSLGYEYTHYGVVRTGYGSGVLANDRLSNSLSSNAVTLSIVRFFQG